MLPKPETTRKPPGSIAAYDENVKQALGMADMMAEGILKQFPNAFAH